MEGRERKEMLRNDLEKRYSIAFQKWPLCRLSLPLRGWKRDIVWRPALNGCSGGPVSPDSFFVKDALITLWLFLAPWSRLAESTLCSRVGCVEEEMGGERSPRVGWGGSAGRTPPEKPAAWWVSNGQLHTGPHGWVVGGERSQTAGGDEVMDELPGATGKMQVYGSTSAGFTLLNKVVGWVRLSWELANSPILYFYPVKWLISGVTIVSCYLITSSDEKTFVSLPLSISTEAVSVNHKLTLNICLGGQWSQR